MSLEMLIVFGAALILVAPFGVKMFTSLTLPAMIARWKDLADEFGRLYHVDPNEILAIMWVESRGRAKAIGAVGEIGLMQIAPICLREYNSKHNISFEMDDLFNPRMNCEVGTWYWNELRTTYRFTERFDRSRAYNAGPTAVRKGISQGVFNISSEYANKIETAYTEITNLRKGEGNVTV